MPKPNLRGALILAIAWPLTVLSTAALACAQSAATPSESHPASAIRQVSGETRRVQVPMVSEPWSATLGRAPAIPTREIPDFGDFPGTREWKRQANARRKALTQTASRDGASGFAPHRVSPQDVMPSLRSGQGLGPSPVIRRPFAVIPSEARNLALSRRAHPAKNGTLAQSEIPGHQFAGTTGQGVVFDGPSESDTHLVPPNPGIG